MKNLLLSAALLSISTMSFAQLYVTPNGATDSYMYVNDEVLFVTDDIELDANNAGTTEASIYLRGTSQLIQGNNVANSGDGFISVYQNTPDDDAWDYTFWASPIGDQDLANSGNQNFGIMRVYDPVTTTDSNQTAITFAVNGIQSPMTISRRWLYRRPAGSGWIPIYTGTNVPTGMGFTMKGLGTTNHVQTYDFRGRPNNGDIVVNIATAGPALSGNPYPSALDLNRLFYDTDASDPDGTNAPNGGGNNEISEFRFWDENRSINSHLYSQNQGGYGVWVPMGSNPNTVNAGMYTVAPFLHYTGGGTATGGQTGSGASYERRYAPIGQGFNIVADADGPITYKNQYRVWVTEGATSEFRTPDGGGLGLSTGTGATLPAPEPQAEDTRIPHLRIHTYFERTHFRDMVLAFSDDATDKYDRGFDAKHPMDAGNAEVYFPVEDGSSATAPYVIQTVPFARDKQVPITFELDEETKFQLKAVDVVNFNVDAFLYDNVNFTYQKITDNQSADLRLPAGNYSDRFYIVFQDRSERSANLNQNEAETRRATVINNVTFFQNNPIAQLEVGNPEGYEIEAALIFDMAGKLVLSQNDLGNSTKLSFPTATFSDGVYLVKLITNENIIIDYKITVYNK